MERVAFLVEATGERIGCLLNPESIEVRRVAGLRPLSTPAGVVSGRALADDPLLYVGGGVTELELELLFDVALAGSTVETDDVRELTSPLWSLAESQAWSGGLAEPALVRFIWGKAWNVPGVVSAAAERLEHFTTDGVPRRSWLKLRFRRVAEPPAPTPAPLDPEAPLDQLVAEAVAGSGEATDTHAVLGGGPADAPELEAEGELPAPAGESLWDIAAATYGHASYWRFIAAVNDILDPLRVPAGTVLRLPPPPDGRSAP